jgi:hypothetical protein
MLLLLLWAIPAGAAERSATVTWAPNSEPDLAGYRIHYGYISCAASGPLQPMAQVGKTSTSYTITNVPDASTIVSARVAAFDASNNESAKSLCVEKVMPAQPPPNNDLEVRVAELEERVAAIEQKLNSLRAGWCGLRNTSITKDVQVERAAMGGC